MRVLITFRFLLFLVLASFGFVDLARAQCGSYVGTIENLSYASTSTPCGSAPVNICVGGGVPAPFSSLEEFDVSLLTITTADRDFNGRPEVVVVTPAAGCQCDGAPTTEFNKYCDAGTGLACGVQSGSILLGNCVSVCPGPPNSVNLNSVCFDYGAGSAPPAGTLNSIMNCVCQTGLECRSDGGTFDRCVTPPPPPSTFVLVATPGTHDFGSQSTGSSTPLALRFRNTGTAQGTGCSAAMTSPSGFTLTALPASCASMDAGEFCDLTLTATPPAVATYNTNVNFGCLQGSLTAGPFTVVGAAAGGLTFTFTPNTFDFGSVAAGSSTASQTITIQNTSTTNATGCTVTPTGADTGGFNWSVGASCSTLNAGQSCSVTLGGNPPSARLFSAPLRISCTEPGVGNSGNFTVVGTGGGYDFSPNGFNFGNVDVGSSSITQIITIQNLTGTDVSSCSVTMVGGAGHFLLSGQAGCSSLATGASCTVNLTGSPIAVGLQTTNLSMTCASAPSAITSSAPFLVTGQTATPLTFSFAPNTHSFGNVTVGLDSDLQSVQITNTSTLSATGCTVSLQGAGAAQFVLTGGATCASLAASASCTVSLLGRPTSAGAMTSQIRIACAEPGTGTSGNFTMNAVPPVVPSGAIACVNSAINCSDYDNELLTPIPMCGGSGCVSCGGPTPFVGVAYDLDGTGRCSCRTRQERVWEDCGLRLFDDLQFVRTSCTATGVGGGSVGICSALMTMSPNTGNLGTVNVNSTSSPITIQINNPTATAATGCSASLQLVAPSTVANFTLTSGCSTVPANGSCNLTLTGTPTSASIFQTGVRLACSGGITTPVSSGPAGFVVTGQNSAAALSFSPSGSAWSAVQGSAFSQLITISNSGGTTVSGCFPILSSPGVFSIGTHDCSSVLASGSCSLTLLGDTNTLIASTPRTLTLTCSGGVTSSASYSLAVTAPTPACEISANDCNKASGSTCGCASGFIKVAKPEKLAIRVPCGTIEVAELKKRAVEAIAKKDWKLLYLIKPILDSLCPDAFAQVTCAGGTCTQSLLELCNNNSLAACSRTITYSDLGSTPTGCTPLASSCTTTITCPAWTPSGGMYSRSCTIANDCFNKTSNTCMPYNNETLFPTSPIVQRIQGSPVTTEGTMMCIPDCDNYGGVSNTGLRFVWSGPNAGQCACASGWVFNFISGRCQPPELMTGCNEGSGSVPPSQVSPFVTSTSGMVGAFRNAVNKKLNCCLNGNPKDFVGRKFDCVDNTINAATSFEALWASRDDDADGGQLNAVLLAGAGGRPLTGFYSIDGKRDPRFSEITATALTRVRINPIAGVITATLGTITKPSGAAFDALVTGLGNLPAPTTVADRIRSPILVRAAAIYDCPRNPVSNIPLKTLQTLTAGVVTKEVCPVAATAKIHVRIEQVSEIIGAPPMKTIDTVIESSQVPSLSIEKLLNQKYGPGCAPGLIQQGEGCVYDVP